MRLGDTQPDPSESSGSMCCATGGELVRLYGPMNRSLAKAVCRLKHRTTGDHPRLLRRASEAGVDAAHTICATE